MKAAEETKKAEVQNDNVATVVEGSEMGDIKIHENVIAALVRKAALTIEGVSRLAGSSLVDNIAEIVGSRRMQARAIALEMDESHRVAIEVKINILVGYKVPELAQSVQKAVIEMIEQTTGMTVTKVNVLVQDIEEPVEEGEETDTAMDMTALPMN
ncbi:MAG: Asp23/Gls24 family envelope stress response protein [Lentisphaeria bacterium]|nr:Asp23/Gls24 family envelope stress response protein [Lentisphaeria bacterium]